ncbi:hypothetical protein Tco_0967473 [Tanacetum coccineum]
MKTPMSSDTKLTKDKVSESVDSIKYRGMIVITGYLVNISKRHAFWSLNEDILKITILKTNTSYPARKIHQDIKRGPYSKKLQYAISNPLDMPHFKTLSLDELRSPDFNLLSDQEYSQEEVVETMTETMEQYMSKTRADYGSGVASSKIKDKDNFELKGQFLKELRTNTFSGSDHEDANEHIEKEVILFYNGFRIPTRQIIDSRGAIPSKTVVDAKIAIQEMAEHSQKWYNGTSRSRNAAIQNQGASIKTLEIQIGQMIKVLQERGFGSLPSSTKSNPRDQVKLISTTIEANSYPIRRIGSSQYAVSTGQSYTLMYETRQMTIPFLSCLNGYYCEENKGSYGPQFSEAYSEAS